MNKLSHLSPARVAVLAACVIGAGVALFTAVAMQQNYRQSANDPEVQMAEDAAAALNAGSASPETATQGPQIDFGRSLAPFLVVTDKQHNILAASGALNGRPVRPPAGTFTPDHRFTWQPAPGVRLAAVVEPYDNGYVVAARNLREIENREDSLRLTALLTLAGIAAVGAAAFAILAP